jgi:hypothetical protein
MREEMIYFYREYIQDGMRHNEFIGRLFPWELSYVEIGHIANKDDKKDIISHIQQANKDCQKFNEKRKLLLMEIKREGLENRLVKEFIDIKNDILTDAAQDSLSDKEKNIILQKIKALLIKDISLASYQNGVFEKIDLPEDSEVLNPKPKPKILTKAKYDDIYDRLKNLECQNIKQTKQKYIPLTVEQKNNIYQSEMYNEEKILKNARNLLKAFLASGINFDLIASRKDSGSLTLSLLKKHSPNLSDHEILEKNIDNLSIDSCISVLTSVSYLNDNIKAKYEKNIKYNPLVESHSYVTATLDYKKTVFNSFADNNDFLDKKRPITSYAVNTYKLNFSSLSDDAQNNLKEAWLKRNEDPFKEKIENFVSTINRKYNIDLKNLINNDNIEYVWNQIKTIENSLFGKNHEYAISHIFFNELGASYNKSLNILDEDFRLKFDKSEWSQNPFGEQYRQHITGKGSLMPLAPSQESIAIFEKEIDNGRRPFTKLSDLEYILSKINNPIDRFGLKGIIMKQAIHSGPSGTALRIMNIYDDVKNKIKNNPDFKNLKIPNEYEMQELCARYLSGDKNHNTYFEINAATYNRRFPARISKKVWEI